MSHETRVFAIPTKLPCANTTNNVDFYVLLRDDELELTTYIRKGKCSKDIQHYFILDKFIIFINFNYSFI